MISFEEFMGGMRYVNWDGTTQVARYRCWTLNPDTGVGPWFADLPDPLVGVTLLRGGPYFYIWNKHGSNTVTVRDSAAVTVAALDPAKIAIVYLERNWRWGAKVMDKG